MAMPRVVELEDGDIVYTAYGLFYYDSSSNELKQLYREKRVIDLFKEMSAKVPAVKWDDFVKNEEVNRIFKKGKEQDE